MPKVRAQDLRPRGRADLVQELEGARRELMNLRFRKATLQLEDTSQIPRTRHKIARILTVLREREQAEG